jgi:hypothetical protein
MPSAIDTIASTKAERSLVTGLAGGAAWMYGCAAATRASTRASISRPTLSRNDSITAD